MVQSSENRWNFRCLWNAVEEFASLIICGMAFQSLGALEKALITVVFQQCKHAKQTSNQYWCNLFVITIQLYCQMSIQLH